LAKLTDIKNQQINLNNGDH